jgi:hypothetical protein
MWPGATKMNKRSKNILIIIFSSLLWTIFEIGGYYLSTKNLSLILIGFISFFIEKLFFITLIVIFSTYEKKESQQK